MIADTFFYYDTVVLCRELEKLNATVSIDAGEIRFEPEASSVDLVLGRALIDAYEHKYPQTKADDIIPATGPDPWSSY